jgi:hypothetical protein
MRTRQALARLALAAVLAAAGALPASAQGQPGAAAPSARIYPGGEVNANPAPSASGVPRDDILEVMVRSVLVTFNDANLTGNYAVLNARFHPQFRQEAPPERLASIFAAFRTNKVNIAPLPVHRPVYAAPPGIDRDGLLVAKGQFDTRPWYTTFDLAWRREGDQWWLWRINVRVRPPEQ